MNLINQPRVSILIPSYNHSAYIEKTIRSVWEQNYSNLELVIIDDGSTDNSREILARLKLVSPILMVIIEQENVGICRTLNRALEKSTGEIIGVLASDDIMLPGRVNQEIAQFTSLPTLKVLYTNGQFQAENVILDDAHKSIKPYLKRGVVATSNHILSAVPGLYIQALLIRRDFLLSVGGFDEDTGSDDWSLNIRIFKNLKPQGEFIFIDRYSFLYRIHSNQMHRSGDFMGPMKRKVVRKFFSIEERSKFVCQIYVKKAFGLYSEKKFKHASRYMYRAKYIGFAKGIPVICLTKFGFDLPGYVYREIMKRLKK